MARDPSYWWHPATQADPGEALRLEAAAGQQQRFAELDALAARLLGAALAGQPLATVTPGRGRDTPDRAEVTALTPAEAALCAGFFSVQEQHKRGAWYLPEKLSVKAGAVNLPHLLRERPGHALTLAADETARLTAVEGADTILLWALLVPLFETLLQPVRLRAAGDIFPPTQQQRFWTVIEERYRLLGIGDGALEAFRYGGAWPTLDRAGQQQARLELLDTLAAADLVQLVARHRIQQLQALMSGFAKKARAGTALARRILTKELQPVVSAYFAGDWLAALDYLQAPVHPDEEIITALPEPRLYVGTSVQTADVAAEAGIAEAEVQAMLAAFLGGGSSVSPVEERTAALRRWWAGFDQAHAVQAPGMPSLWGLVDEELMSLSRTEQGFTPQLYQQCLPADVLDEVGRLWATVTLQRYPGRIVSNPRPHRIMADALGPAGEFWHGVGLTAWFVCEGPYSRTTLGRADRYYSKSLAALRAAGCPVDPSFFRELAAAEQLLGPEEDITDSTSSTVEIPYGQVIFTSGMSGRTRRKGFEGVRDLITLYRRAWTEQHLATYLQHRWRTELESVAHQLHRHVAAKGKPPTLTQFSRFATETANHWTGGDLGALYTAIGEPAPSEQERPAHLLTGDGYDVARRVYRALGGEPVDHDTWLNRPEETQRQWQLGRLAAESLRYLQLQEALGQPPTAKQFGAQRLRWPWPGEEAEGWPRLQQVLAALTGTSSASEQSLSLADGSTVVVRPRDGGQQMLAKGANAPLAPEEAAIRVTASGVPVDVSAVLLTDEGRVRSDDDLVFYNHPFQDGVRVDGGTVTAELGLIPEGVSSIAIVVSVDPEGPPGAVLDQNTVWEAQITQPSGARLSFVPPPFTGGETVAVAVEVYRRTGSWKVRAVGQGYASGLAGLATDYGIDVEA
ncbi:stress response protein SCP2 [Streptomyces sp. T12]|uniref:TerD family protein n=1 Tax=Streptomyces sp. T12 TaxID=477697 RepID=UPI0011A3A6D5|nr:TerD family protein [Streptomyces sp. T12]TWD29707.1 stress response protein SCP2 [Streptomyces sp. T12]